MKKVFVIALISLFSFGTLVANPADTTFKVTTTVKSVNEMKLTIADYSNTAPVPVTLADVDGFTETVVIDNTGTTTPFTAYISALSNNEDGFIVYMSAVPMTVAESEHGYEIDYTVTAGSSSYTTGVTESAVKVFDVSELEALTAYSAALSIEVDAPTFARAIEDTYIGTVTFNYESN